MVDKDSSWRQKVQVYSVVPLLPQWLDANSVQWLFTEHTKGPSLLLDAHEGYSLPWESHTASVSSSEKWELSY